MSKASELLKLMDEANEFDAKSLAKMFGGNEKDGRAYFPVSKWDQVIKSLDQKYGKHEDNSEDSDHSKSFTWPGICGAAVTGNNMMVMGADAQLESNAEVFGWWVRSATATIVDGPFDSEEEAAKSKKLSSATVKDSHFPNGKPVRWYIVKGNYFMIEHGRGRIGSVIWQ